MAYGIEVFNDAGIEVMNTSRPFNLVSKIRLDNGEGLSTVFIPIPNAVSGQAYEVMSGSLGTGTFDLIYNAGGGTGLYNIDSVSISGTTLVIDISTVSTGGKGVWDFSVFARRN